MIIINGRVGPITYEDSKQAAIAEVDEDTDFSNSSFFIRLHSWSEVHDHQILERLIGKRVKIVIDTEQSMTNTTITHSDKQTTVGILRPGNYFVHYGALYIICGFGSSFAQVVNVNTGELKNMPNATEVEYVTMVNITYKTELTM